MGERLDEAAATLSAPSAGLARYDFRVGNFFMLIWEQLQPHSNELFFLER